MILNSSQQITGTKITRQVKERICKVCGNAYYAKYYSTTCRGCRSKAYSWAFKNRKTTKVL